ncbi:TonB-dependent receptor [Kineobactrum salinum]|uniref:TonB-dependent receptor n=1 Tax=Kineobactrum salinum TaxID=2708301 RepID=A0A6C0U4J1_9GAMM|nr:TonB-dependent receptor [Kineobactrum salinum]
MLGAYYEDRDTERSGHVTGTNAEGQLDGSGTTVFARDNRGTREQLAAFGEASYDFLPSWTFTVGLRWFEVERSEEQTTVTNFFGPTGPQPFETFAENDVISRYKLSWDATDDVFLYALAAQGFRVGGPNQPVGFDSTAPDFDSDGLWTYELGWKTSLFDGGTYFNGAVYHVDWSDIQFLTTDATGAFELIGNGGDATVTGFELELQARPLDNLEVSGGVGYADATFSGTQPEQALPQNQPRDGERLPGVPKWSTTLFAQYTLPMSNGANALVNADWAYRSDSTTGLNPGASNYRKLDDYHQLNFRAGVEWTRWKIMLAVNNVLDDRPEVAGRVYDLEPYQFSTVPPRTIGVTVDYRYR